MLFFFSEKFISYNERKVIYMTNLKQEEIEKALIQLVNIRYLIDDGYHNKELCELIKVSNTLFEELSDANKIVFQIWLDKKMNENGID